jgi:hypothetical protein
LLVGHATDVMGRIICVRSGISHSLYESFLLLQFLFSYWQKYFDVM